MTGVLSAVFAAVFSVTSFPAAQADKVGQGAGMAENNLAFAYEHLDLYIRICLGLSSCSKSEKETRLLTAIMQGMETERRSPQPQIGFKSQSKDGIFFIDGKLRVAMTWPTPGARIYFDLEQIYRADGHGKVRGIEIDQAVAFLVHEFGHHYGESWHEWLDEVGHHVGAVVKSELNSTILHPYRSNIEATWIDFNDKAGPLSTQVLLSDGPNLYDITGKIFSNFRCPKHGNRPSFLQSLRLWGLQWRDHLNPAPKLIAYALPLCRDFITNEPFTPTDCFGMLITTPLQFNNNGSSWGLTPELWSFRQLTCQEVREYRREGSVLLPQDDYSKNESKLTNTKEKHL